jgi:CheY-like chemotaxis protein
VLLLDLNMPDIDGYGLAEMVRADPRLATPDGDADQLRPTRRGRSEPSRPGSSRT